MANLRAGIVSNAKPFILVIWPMTFALLLVGLFLYQEDLRTTMAGYQAFPSAKITNSWWLSLAVSLALSGIPVVFGYWYMGDTDRFILLVISAGCMLCDIFFDVTFKVTGFQSIDYYAYIFSSTESLIVYTLGSEILVTFCLGFLWEGLDEFSNAIELLLPSAVSLPFKIINAFLYGADQGIQPIKTTIGDALGTDKDITLDKPQHNNQCNRQKTF